LGAALKAIRTRNGWRLLDVSQKTGLTPSTLSKIENGKLSVTYDKLTLLSTKLGVDIAEFFAADGEAIAPPPPVGPIGRRSITRARGGHSVKTASYNHCYPAADLRKKSMVPMIAELKMRSITEFGPLLKHSGEEFTLVLEGICEFHSEFYEPVILKTGDSIYFDSAMGHAYLAAGSGVCKVVSVCSGVSSDTLREIITEHKSEHHGE